MKYKLVYNNLGGAITDIDKKIIDLERYAKEYDVEKKTSLYETRIKETINKYKRYRLANPNVENSIDLKQIETEIDAQLFIYQEHQKNKQKSLNDIPPPPPKRDPNIIDYEVDGVKGLILRTDYETINKYITKSREFGKLEDAKRNIVILFGYLDDMIKSKTQELKDGKMRLYNGKMQIIRDFLKDIQRISNEEKVKKYNYIIDENNKFIKIDNQLLKTNPDQKIRASDLKLINELIELVKQFVFYKNFINRTYDQKFDKLDDNTLNVITELLAKSRTLYNMLQSMNQLLISYKNESLKDVDTRELDIEIKKYNDYNKIVDETILKLLDIKKNYDLRMNEMIRKLFEQDNNFNILKQKIISYIDNILQKLKST